MSEKNLIQAIKDYRKFVDLGSSDSDSGEMASPGGRSDDEPKKLTAHTGEEDSGFDDTSKMSQETYGPMTSTPKPRGAIDAVYGIPGTATRQYELTNNGLEGGTYNTLPIDQSSLQRDELPNPSTQLDFSDRVRVDTSLLSGAPNQTTRQQDVLPELQGELPCNVYYVNEGSGTLQAFQTFNELSEYLVDAAVQMQARRHSADYVMKKLVRLHLDTLGCYITVGEYLHYLYSEDKLADVAVHVQDKTFSAHRVALSCYSGYFAELFSFNTGKKIPFEMRLKGIYPEAFAVFLEFVYTGKLNIYDAISADLIIIADFLKVEALKQRCADLSRGLPLDQALKLVVKCEGKTSGRIYRTVFHKCIQNFSEICKLPIILELDINTFCQMLSSDDLFVHSEFEVFQIAVRWIAHDIEERLKYTVRIINLIRFHYMTVDELYTCAETTSFMRDYDRFREAILKANWIITGRLLMRDDPFKFPMLPPRNCYMIKFVVAKVAPMTVSFQADNTPTVSFQTENDPTVSFQTENVTEIARKFVPVGQNPPIPAAPPVPTNIKHAKPVMIPTSLQTQAKIPPKTVDILVVGGYQSEHDKFVERYDSEDNQWVHFCRLPEPRIHHAVAMLGNTLYLIGGSDPRTPGDILLPSSKTFALDLTSKEWKRVADMTVSRMDHCACSLSGMIYAIGGRGLHNNILGSVECYNPDTDNWFLVSPMSSARACASACALKGRMYVVGGLGEMVSIPASKHVLSSCEVFDPSKNSWSPRNNLRFPRTNACLVNVRNRLFLCGGARRTYDYKNSVLVSAASIDEYIEDHDMWCHRTDMIIPRHDAGVTVAGDRIYIIGGISSTADRVLQSVECYDTRQALWLSGVQDLPYPTRWICCVTINSKYHRPNPDQAVYNLR